MVVLDMVYLKENGRLDIEKINKLSYEKYMDVMGRLTEEQVNEYLSALPINEANEPVQAVNVGYTLEDELEKGAVIANDYIQNRMRELKRNDI